MKDDLVGVKKIKAAKDLSKLFMLAESQFSSILLTLDTRFLGYKSGILHRMSKLICESSEYITFIENNYHQCSTFLKIATNKYNAELNLIKSSCQQAEKGKKNKDQKDSKDIREDLRMMVMYSHMSKGLEEYIINISQERKELPRREENIQNELEKIENVVTNNIMSSIEVAIMKLSTLRSFSLIKEKYAVVGLDSEIIDMVIEKLFSLYSKFEQLNLVVVEAKLDIKNLYAFLNKLTLVIDKNNNQPDESEMALNPLNKVPYDANRLLKFFENDKGLFDLKNLEILLEKSSRLMNNFSKDLNKSSSLDETLISNLMKACTQKKRVREEDKSQNDTESKISEQISDTKDLFSKLYKLPESRISKYYQPLQKIELTSSENSYVLDMYIDSFKINEKREEFKSTINEANLCDSNEFETHLIIAMKYHFGSSLNLICIYFQTMEKKFDKEEDHLVNLGLLQIPDGYDISEGVFHNKDKLLAILYPQ